VADEAGRRSRHRRRGRRSSSTIRTCRLPDRVATREWPNPSRKSAASERYRSLDLLLLCRPPADPDILAEPSGIAREVSAIVPTSKRLAVSARRRWPAHDQWTSVMSKQWPLSRARVWAGQVTTLANGESLAAGVLL